MTANLQSAQASLYETDYVRWVETTLEHLKAKDYASVDWANLLEEIEDMSRRERQSLESNLVIVLLHLLKWQYQPEQRGNSWKGSLVEHRRHIRKSLKASPSLKPYLQECFDEAYGDAVEQAAAETGLVLALFPVVCSYTMEQVLDSDFFPE
jgi:Domain of unknown function DUF29